VAREKKHRVATEAAPELRTNPFAALEIQGRESASAGRDTRPACPPPSKRTSEPLVPTPGEKLLLHELKTSLGCGGKIEDRTLELQGELADRLIPLLEARNITIKRGW
jgi:hypothetical protein